MQPTAEILWFLRRNDLPSWGNWTSRFC